MDNELKNEVLSSNILKVCHFLARLNIFRPKFMVTGGILLSLTFISYILNLNVFSVILIILSVFWGFGILYAFITGFFHAMTGRIIRRMSEKYDMHPIILKYEIFDILKNRK